MLITLKKMIPCLFFYYFLTKLTTNKFFQSIMKHFLIFLSSLVKLKCGGPVVNSTESDDSPQTVLPTDCPPAFS